MIQLETPVEPKALPIYKGGIVSAESRRTSTKNDRGSTNKQITVIAAYGPRNKALNDVF